MLIAKQNSSLKLVCIKNCSVKSCVLTGAESKGLMSVPLEWTM